MKILIIVDCYLPSEKSIAKMTDDLAREFISRHHEVSILVPAESLGSSVEVDASPGLEVIRYRSGKMKGASLIVRAFNESMISLTAYRRTRRLMAERRYDAIVFYSPSIFFGPLVAHFKRKWNIKAYLILRDIFPDWAVQACVMKRGPVCCFFRAFARLQYAVADVIGVESRRYQEYFAKTRYAGKLELLRNWAARYNPEGPDYNYRRQLGLDGKTVFFYGGNFGVAQDMDNILRLAKRMSAHPETHFLLVGDGSEAGRLRARVRQENIRNVTILPAVDQESYLAMLSQFDVGLISLDRRLKTFNNPGKMLGYMGCGIPILASTNPGNDELIELLHTSGAGLRSVNGDDEKFFLNAMKLCDPELRKGMGENSRRLLAAEFSTQMAAGKILRALGNVPEIITKLEFPVLAGGAGRNGK